MLLSFKIQIYLNAKARNEPSEAVVGTDGVKKLCHQRPLFRVDIDDHRSRGVESQIFFKLVLLA